MTRLVLPHALLAKIRTTLLASEMEACAILFGRAVEENGRLLRLVIREGTFPTHDDYEVRSETQARLKSTFVAAVAQRARRSRESVVFVHSHPFALNEFSAVDDIGERALEEFLSERTPGLLHAAMLVTPAATIARILGPGARLKVFSVGETLTFDTGAGLSESSDQFDRQIRMFGRVGQERLKRLRVGIVGLGGTGSIVAQQLAHLGIANFLLIDPDQVSLSNLNRLVGARRADVGLPKVQVAQRMVNEINPDARVSTYEESALLAQVATRLIDVDFVFGCTDSQGSRAVLNQLSYQFLLPMIDMGVSIVAADGHVSHMAGRVNMLAAGLGCFVCGQLLNPEAVRVDLLTDFERAADPYVVGSREPAPAVISLNSTVASLAVTMFLDAVLEIGASARFINYNGISGAARPASISPHPQCYVCSERGAFAQAGAWPLPGRLK
jgi:molybdopterin-synthase adenylyltransferase